MDEHNIANTGQAFEPLAGKPPYFVKPYQQASRQNSDPVFEPGSALPLPSNVSLPMKPVQLFYLCAIAIAWLTFVGIRDQNTAQSAALFQSDLGNWVDIGWSADGSLIATSHQSHFVGIWDAATGQLVRMLTVSVPGFSSVYRMAVVSWSPDSTKLALTAVSNDVQSKVAVVVIDSTTGQTLLTLPDEGGGRFTHDNDQIRTSHQQGFAPDAIYILKRWEVSSGRLLFSTTPFNNLSDWAWSPDGRYLVIAGEREPDFMPKIWDIEAGVQIRQFQQDTGLVLMTEWSPDRTRIATANNDRTARIWDAALGELLQTIEMHSSVNAVYWSPDSSKLVVGVLGFAQIFDPSNGQPLSPLFPSFRNVNVLSWSPDGTRLVVMQDSHSFAVVDSMGKIIVTSQAIVPTTTP